MTGAVEFRTCGLIRGGVLLLLLLLTPAGASAMDLRAVQSALSERGYNVGPADGVMGPRTGNAIRAFEANNSMPVTGEISEALIRLLAPRPDLPPIVLRPPKSLQAAKVGEPADEKTAVFAPRTWRLQDLGSDGRPAGASVLLRLQPDGSVRGPRFAVNMRWEAANGEIRLIYQSVVGQRIERRGRADGHDRVAGDALGPGGERWRWIAEAEPDARG